MNKDKISIQEIIDLVASKAGVSKRAAEEFLKVFIATIEDTLINGESVKIKDFGTFKLQWNAPRKSVNIQTGEEILLSGFHKVTFTPDSTLKEMVNEPFAHLESVVLDGSNEMIDEDDTEVELNPLRIFEEQASEIKNLLSEIQVLYTNPKQISVQKEEKKITEEKIETDIKSENEILTTVTDKDEEKNSDAINYISEYEVVDKDKVIVENIDEETVEDTDQSIDSNLIEKVVQNQVSNVVTEKDIEIEAEKIVVCDAEFTSNPFIEVSKPQRKTKKRLWVIIFIVILLGGGISSYIFYPPANDFINLGVSKGKNLALTFKESASTTDLLNTISKWFTPKSKVPLNPETVIIPKDIVFGDSIIEEDMVDSLQILFDTPRVYPEYIATERIVSGSRLARMSERYYGKSDFWVYIYEANQNRIPNPDNIPSGTLIYIPKVDPRLIDVTNPRCLKKARELHDLYVKSDATR